MSRSRAGSRVRRVTSSLLAALASCMGGAPNPPTPQGPQPPFHQPPWPETPDPDITPAQPVPAAAADLDAPPPDSLVPTQPVGAARGSFAVDDAGAATYALALLTPPGRADIEPRIGLHYSSHAGNGPLGIGWSLSGVST